MKQFSEDLLNRIRSSIDIEAVISSHVQLRRSGSRFVGLCPFHDEKSPSFMVFPQDGARWPHYHCFGCQERGDAIKFFSRITGATFVDAVHHLAAQCGISVEGGTVKKPWNPGFQPQAKVVLPRIGSAKDCKPLTESVATMYAKTRTQLRHPRAVSYLASRNLTPEHLEPYGCGFLAIGEIERGFVGPRIVIPHTIPGGEIVSLYGRSCAPDSDKIRKHWNLYRVEKGLFNAAALELPGPLYLTEGPFDALTLLAAGVQKTIAVFGLDGFDRNWVSGQREIVICLDNDKSGVAAAEKLKSEFDYRGIKSRILDSATAYGGCKDANEAWQKGVLNIPGIPARKTAIDVSSFVSKVNSIPSTPPAEHLKKGWEQYRRTALWLANTHLESLLSCGWTERQVFALPTNRAGLDGGLAWTLSGFKIERLEVSEAAVSASGMTQTRAGFEPPGAMPW